jgi:tetratricopeptide (TPR) repeat protein
MDPNGQQYAVSGTNRQRRGAAVTSPVGPPDPGSARSLDDLSAQLRALKAWAGGPSYEQITRWVTAALTTAGAPPSELPGKTTVVDCFRPGRRRLNTELVMAVVRALHDAPGYVTQWRQALSVVSMEVGAAAQVRVSDSLPTDPTGFVGRGAELDQLRSHCRRARRSGRAAVVSAEGMAGVGKTQLALRAGHLLHREEKFDRVLFANLRGFHPDPAQPPADPAAVLDGFLRLLGVPGRAVPHGLPARTALFREKLACVRALVVLDNAADDAQVRPLLAQGAGSLTIITARRTLADLPAVTHLPVGVLGEKDAIDLLTRSAPDVPAGADPDAAARIARDCGCLPLALGLTAGHLRDRSGWTLTDHADRLDERRRDGRLEAGVQTALDLSYRHLPVEQRTLVRLAALHPGHDVDVYAAAALAGTDHAAAADRLDQLRRHHLLQQLAPGRYTLHDLVRAFAAERACDEDRPADRRSALTRLFDFYLATAAAAVDVRAPADARHRPAVPAPAAPAPAFADATAAKAWLDSERLNLLAVAAHCASQGWPTHVTRLSTVLFRYLIGSHPNDALTLHGLALDTAERTGDLTAQANATMHFGVTCMTLSHLESASDHFQRALRLFERLDHPAGRSRCLGNLGVVDEILGRYPAALRHHTQALEVFRQLDDLPGQARTVMNIGVTQEKLGRYELAVDHHTQALRLFRELGELDGEATALADLGLAEVRLRRHGPAAQHLDQALRLFRQVGNRSGEGWTLNRQGTLRAATGHPGVAADLYRQALDLHRETEDRQGIASALNGLGEAANARGAAAEAIDLHTEAHDIATGVGDQYERARALRGLGGAHHKLGAESSARDRYAEGLALYAEMGVPQAGRDHNPGAPSSVPPA